MYVYSFEVNKCTYSWATSYILFAYGLHSVGDDETSDLGRLLLFFYFFHYS